MMISKFSLVVFTALCALTNVEFVYATCAHQAGYVYIIGEQGNTNYYKVGGSTIGAQSRINSIQIGNPRTLVSRVQFAVQDCYNAENAAHTALQANVNWQYVGHEWYYVQPNQYNAFQNTVRNTVANHEAAALSVNDADNDVKDENNLMKLIKSLLA